MTAWLVVRAVLYCLFWANALAAMWAAWLGMLQLTPLAAVGVVLLFVLLALAHAPVERKR